jgi:hypothetical protein
MAQIRRVLGHVVVETAARRRTCYRDRKNHTIPKGEACLVIKDSASGQAKNYCPVCALAILNRAGEDLQQLRISLG